jgi:transposase
MSLQPKPCYEAPEETVRVARAAFPQGTLCTRIYDALGTIFQDADFVPIFPPQGNRLKLPFGWRSPRSCSSSNVYRIAPPLTPCVLASIGSICSVWN